MGRRWPNPRQTGVHVSSRTRWSSSLDTGTAKKGCFGERFSVPWEGGLRPLPLNAAKRECGGPSQWSPSITELPVPRPRCLPTRGEAAGSRPAPPFVWRCRRQAGQMWRCLPRAFRSLRGPRFRGRRHRTDRFTLHPHSSSPPAPQRSAPRISPRDFTLLPRTPRKGPGTQPARPRPEAALAPWGQQVAPRASAAEAGDPSNRLSSRARGCPGPRGPRQACGQRASAREEPEIVSVELCPPVSAPERRNRPQMEPRAPKTAEPALMATSSPSGR